MPTEIITTKRNTEIGRLLERVIRDHRKDISAYSRGHLNENNLYKPPEAGRKSWGSAKLPAIKLKHAVSVEKEDRDKTMWDAIACFSAGSPLGADKQAAKPKVDKEDPLQGLSVEKDDVNLEEFDASYFMIPKADGYKVVPSLEGCLSKRDELAQRKQFDEQIVEKHNLTDRGWYDGTRATKNIKFNPSAGKYNNIQVYQKLWSEVLQSCSIYNPILGDIKDFYQGYHNYLNKSPLTAPSSTADLKSKDLSDKNRKISALSHEVTGFENKALEIMKTNEKLKEQHDVTLSVISEIKIQSEMIDSVTSNTDSILEQPTLATQVDTLRRDILQKRADIQALHQHQRRVMVPMEVYQCMVQCVQSAEIELQKSVKSKEALDKKFSKQDKKLSDEFEKLGLSAEQRKQLMELAAAVSDNNGTPDETT